MERKHVHEADVRDAAGAGHLEDDRRLHWDERHAGGDFEGEGPNPVLVSAVEGLPHGRALELACGSGTNAVWLAEQGWNFTAVDWSSVAIANGRSKAEAADVEVEWLERDLFAWTPPERAFDLVAIVYLHLEEAERAPVYRAAAAAIAPGGRLVVVGHDRSHGAEGLGGPPVERLFTAAEIGDALAASDPGLKVERADVVRRTPPPERGPIDALLVVRRQGGS